MTEEIKTEETKELSQLEKAEQTLKEMQEIEKRLDEKRKQIDEMQANALMAGTAGGHIESMKTPEQREDEIAQKMADEIVGAFKR